MADLMSCGDGDTELGTDIAGDQADEEWQGVGDGMDAEDDIGDQDESMEGDSDEEDDDGSAIDDIEADEEEGLTIYENDF